MAQNSGDLAPQVPSSVKEKNVSSTYGTTSSKSDPLGGYSPVYNKTSGGQQGGQLLGFQKGSTFIPKEAAVNKQGQYQPQNVSPVVTTKKGGGSSITGYTNLSGQGSTDIVKQGSNTYYNVTSGGGRYLGGYGVPSSTLNQDQTISQPVKSFTADNSITSNSSNAVLSPSTSNNIVNLQKNYNPEASMSFGQKVLSAFNQYTSPEFYRNIAQQASGTGQYQGPAPISAFASLFAPLQVFASQRTGESRAPNLTYSGTGIYNPSTKQYETPSQFQGKTQFENLQTQAIINPDIVKRPAQIAQETSQSVVSSLQPQYESLAANFGAGLQNRINEGKISVDQANVLYKSGIESLQSQFQTQATSQFNQVIGPKLAASDFFRGQYTKAANTFSVNVPALATTIALVGSSFTAGSSYAGIRAISGIANAGIAVEGQTNIYQGIANKNFLQASLGTAAFALGTYGALRYAANEVTIAQIQGATSQTPVRQYGVRFDQGSPYAALRENQYMDVSRYQQVTPTARALTRETIFSEYYPLTNTFRISSGTSETTIATTDFWTGRTLFVGSYRTFQGGGQIGAYPSLAGESVVQPGLYGASEGFAPSITKLTTTQQYSYSYFQGGYPSIRLGGPIISNKQYGAESRLQEGFINSKSGELVQKPFVDIQGQGFIFRKPQQGLYKQEVFSTIQVNPGGTINQIEFIPFPSSGLRGIPTPGTASAESISQVQTPFLSQYQSQTFGEAAQYTNPSVFQIPGLSLGPLQSQGFSQVQFQNYFSAASGASSQFLQPRLESEQRQYQISTPVLQSRQFQPQPQIPGIIQTQPPRGGQSEAQAQIPALIEVPGLQQPQFPGLVPGSPGGFNPFGFTNILFPGLPFNFPLDFGGPRSKPLPGGKQRTKYVPDFAALAFKIRGRAPPGGAAPSPFASRPIPKGYTFAFSEGPNYLKNIFRRRAR